MFSVRSVVLVLGVVVTAALVKVLIGTRKWTRTTALIATQVCQLGAGDRGHPLNPQQLEDLPQPVARYFRKVLPQNPSRVTSVVVTQQGEFRVGESEKDWKPLSAKQYFSVAPAGFIWDARIRMTPFLDVRVRDSYLGGAAAMTGTLFGLFRVVNERDKPELANAALQRYLAEAVWFPVALLPGERVRWEAMDSNSARATLTDSGLSVSLEFHFNGRDEIVRVFAPSRYREVEGSYSLTPWEASLKNYAIRYGFCIPLEAEVAWHLPGRVFSYWRGRIVDIKYRAQ